MRSGRRRMLYLRINTGKEKYEYINITELLKRVMFFHDLYVKDMLIRNIESGRSFDDYSVLDWDMDINR